MRATTLARRGPATVSLDNVEAPAAEFDAGDVVVLFRGQRVPVSADAEILPLVPVRNVKR